MRDVRDKAMDTAGRTVEKVVRGQDPVSAAKDSAVEVATELATQVVNEAKPRTRNKTLRDKKGDPMRGQRTSREKTTDLTLDFTQVRGYDILNESSASISYESEVDTSLYENPYVLQDAAGFDQANYNRTIFNVIEPEAFVGLNAQNIVQDVFSQFKQTVNTNTNGGNKVTNDKLTYPIFKEYIQDVYEMFYLLVELMTRQAWAAEEEHSNRALRRIALYTSSDTAILEIRNELANVLSSACLPKKMYDYAYWMNQVYKTNDHNYAIEQFLSTPTFGNNLLASPDITGYVSELRTKIDTFRASITDNSQLTALLMNKAGGNFVSLRNVHSPANTSKYDENWNDLFQNMSSRQTNDGSTFDIYPPRLSGNDVSPCAFTNSVNTLPIHVTESLLDKWLYEYPFMFRLSSIVATSPDIGGSSRYIIFENDAVSETDNRQYYIRRRDNMPRQIGDDVTLVEEKADGSGFYWVTQPKGNQSYLYDPAPAACRLAQRRFAMKLFS